MFEKKLKEKCAYWSKQERKETNQILRKIAKKFPKVKINIIGSRAKGKVTGDIDIAVIANQPIEISDFVKNNILTEVNIMNSQKKVIYANWDEPAFKYRIKRNGIQIDILIFYKYTDNSISKHFKDAIIIQECKD